MVCTELYQQTIQLAQHGGHKLNILTTHVGSLPRSQRVVDFIFARERNESFSIDEFDAVMKQAVEITVKKQKEAGVDIVSDGETSRFRMQLM